MYSEKFLCYNNIVFIKLYMLINVDLNYFSY